MYDPTNNHKVDIDVTTTWSTTRTLITLPKPPQAPPQPHPLTLLGFPPAANHCPALGEKPNLLFFIVLTLLLSFVLFVFRIDGMHHHVRRTLLCLALSSALCYCDVFTLCVAQVCSSLFVHDIPFDCF